MDWYRGAFKPQDYEPEALLVDELEEAVVDDLAEFMEH